MKILAFAASNSRQSINKQLIAHTADIFKTEVTPSADIEILDLNDYEMPIYSIDRETEHGIPQLAHIFFEKIGAADAMLISYAEHNGGYTAAYKNLFDWTSRLHMKVFQDTPMVILSASPGKNGGATALKTARDSAPFFGADIRGSLSVGFFPETFQDGKLVDPELAQKLREALSTLPQAVA